MKIRVNDLVEFRGKIARVKYVYGDDFFDVMLIPDVNKVNIAYEKIHLTEIKQIL